MILDFDLYIVSLVKRVNAKDQSIKIGLFAFGYPNALLACTDNYLLQLSNERRIVKQAVH